jgi:hypothetical protein
VNDLFHLQTDVAALKAEGLGATEIAKRRWMTMTVRSFLRIAVIIALAVVNFVILGFAAYSIFLVVKWLVGLV